MLQEPFIQESALPPLSDVRQRLESGQKERLLDTQGLVDAVQNEIVWPPPIALKPEMVSHFKRAYPEIFFMLSEGGIDPEKALPLRDPYAGKVQTEHWANAVHHSITVALGAAFLASELVRAEQFPESAVSLVLRLGLRHDACRRLEKYEAAARRRVETLGGHFEPLSMEALIERGVPALLARNHCDGRDFTASENADKWMRMGLSGELITIPDQMLASCAKGNLGSWWGDLTKLLVRLADDMTQTIIPERNGTAVSYLLTAAERIAAGHERPWYSVIFKGGWGLRDGSFVRVSDISAAGSDTKIISSYAGIQIYLANRACDVIKAMLKPRDPQPADIFVKNLLQSGVENKLAELGQTH